MVGLACICTSLIALVATIARQIRNDYSEKERNKWPKLVLLMGSISFVWGLFVDFGGFRKCKRYHRIYYARVGVSMLQYFQQSNPAG